jgi:hypothetical protein
LFFPEEDGFVEILLTDLNSKYQTITNYQNSKIQICLPLRGTIEQAMSLLGRFWSLNTCPVKFRLKADPRKAGDLTG